MYDRLIPVIADSRKDFGESCLLRCTYFYVAVDESKLLWVTGPQGLEGTTFLLGGAPVVSVGPDQADLLSSGEEIQRLFASIEEDDSQTVETAALWVPHAPIAGVLGRKIVRGDVLRLTVPLFRSAYLFGEGAWTQEEMESLWREHAEALGQVVREEERAAFGHWMGLQIKRSKDRHDALEDAGVFLARKSKS